MSTDFQDLGRRIVGPWTTEATHPAFPGTVVRGAADVEWLEGERFLIFRARTDHPDFPDSVSVIGDTDGLRMHYFDSRGVYRLYAFSISDEGWTFDMDRDAPTTSFAARDAPFSQRMRVTFADEDRTMIGKSQLSHDGENWDDDLEITYRRTS